MGVGERTKLWKAAKNRLIWSVNRLQSRGPSEFLEEECRLSTRERAADDGETAAADTKLSPLSFRLGSAVQRSSVEAEWGYKRRKKQRREGAKDGGGRRAGERH